MGAGIELGSSLRALLLVTEPSFQSPKGGSYAIRTIWALQGLMDRETEAGVCSPGRWLISLAPVEMAGFALRGENTHLARVMGPPSHPNAGFSFQRLRSQDLEFRAAARVLPGYLCGFLQGFSPTCNRLAHPSLESGPQSAVTLGLDPLPCPSEPSTHLSIWGELHGALTS